MLQPKQILRISTRKTSETLKVRSTSSTPMKLFTQIFRYGSLMPASKENGPMRLATIPNARKALKASPSAFTVAITTTILTASLSFPLNCQISQDLCGLQPLMSLPMKSSKEYPVTPSINFQKCSLKKKPRRDYTNSSRSGCPARKSSKGTSSTALLVR